MRGHIWFALLSIAFVTGCEKESLLDQFPEQTPSSAKHQQKKRLLTLGLENEDPQMAAAVVKARTTVDEFIAALSQPSPSQSSFTVKVEVTQKDKDPVYLWLSPVRIERDTFVGNLSRQPRNLTEVELGDEITVRQNSIYDWMYSDDGRVVGGHTIRVMSNRVQSQDQPTVPTLLKEVEFAEE